MNFDAVILAGGRSSRMGQDKAWLQFEGEPLLARQVRLVREVGAEEVFISGRANLDYSRFGCRVLFDRLVDAGPLGGVESALLASSFPLLLVLAVDMPKMQSGLLRELALTCSASTGAIPRVNGKIEPLAAIYPKSAVGLIAELLSVSHQNQMGKEKTSPSVKMPGMTRVAEECVGRGFARFVEVTGSAAQLFANWNSPEQVERGGLA
jgi:molybdenum cofactor guanylyltransferase